MVKGKAGVRDQAYFYELVDLVLEDQVRKFVEAAFQPEGNSEEFPEFDEEALSQKTRWGLLEMKQYAEFDKFFRASRAARHPDAMPFFVLAGLVTHEVSLCLEDELGVLNSFASRELVESLVQDPEALRRLLLLVHRKETEEAKRSLAEDLKKLTTKPMEPPTQLEHRDPSAGHSATFETVLSKKSKTTVVPMRSAGDGTI